jgi:hypothetical protein
VIEHHLLPKTDGFVNGSGSAKTDWITEDDLQRRTCRSLQEIVVLMNIVV